MSPQLLTYKAAFLNNSLLWSTWSESLRGACEALRRPWSARKIGAACNALANKSVESGVPRRVAPRPHGKAMSEGPRRRAQCSYWGPQGRRSRREGPRRNFGCGYYVGTRYGARFWIAPIYHARWCFLGKQHVTWPSIVRLRDFPSHRTVLPPCTVTIPCIIAEKALKMARFSNKGSRNMAETCAIDFSYPTSYSTFIVIERLSALLLPFLMWAGPDFENFTQNRQSAVFAFCSKIWSPLTEKTRKPSDTIFGSLVVGWELYWYSSKHLLRRIYFADKWRCKCAVRTSARKNAQGGKFEHPFLPHIKFHRRRNYNFARNLGVLWSACVISSLRNDALNFERNLKIAKLAKFGEPYLDLGTEIKKKPTTRSFLFYPRTIRITHNISSYTSFSHILPQNRHYPKNWKIWRAPWGPLLGIRRWNFAGMGCS